MTRLNAANYTQEELLILMTDTPESHLELENVCGQRYLGCGWKNDKQLTIHGTAGNNLGAFAQGPQIVLYGNAQEGVGNTMSGGRIVIHGRVGDVAGYGMRGGELYIRDHAGYRLGIHMKAYREYHPMIVMGGNVGAFCGEYMAGGDIVVLGLMPGERPLVGRHCGTGMYGGSIYLRGEYPEQYLAANLMREILTREELTPIIAQLTEFSELFSISLDEILSQPFTRLTPAVKRPFAHIYTGFVS
ncbi:MAG: glutamate synthase [Methylocystaceae bacterium]